MSRARTHVRWKATVASLGSEDGRVWIAVTVAAGWMLALGTRLVIPPLLPQITAEFAISNTTVGVAVTLLWLAYASVQFPAGVLADRVGEQRILVSGMGIAAISIVGLAVAPSLTVFFVACAAFGLGTGLFAPPRVTILSKTFPTNDGTVMGVTFAAGNVGAAVLPFVAGVLAVRFGWRFGISFVFPAFVLVCYALWRTIPRDSTARMAAGRQSPRQITSRLARILRDRTIILLGLANALTAFTYQGFTAFFPLYLVTIKGLDQSTAAVLFGVFFATGALVQPFAGYLSDKFGERGLLIALTIVHGVALLSLPFVHTVGWLVALVVVLGTRAGVGPVNNAFLVGSLPDDVQGAGYGLLRSIIMAVSATGSIVVGVFADADYFDAAFAFLAVVIVIAMICYVLLPTDSRHTHRTA